MPRVIIPVYSFDPKQIPVIPAHLHRTCQFVGPDAISIHFDVLRVQSLPIDLLTSKHVSGLVESLERNFPFIKDHSQKTIPVDAKAFNQVLEHVRYSVSGKDISSYDESSINNNLIIVNCCQLWVDFITRLEVLSLRNNQGAVLNCSPCKIETYRQPFIDPTPLLIHLIIPNEYIDNLTPEYSFNPLTCSSPINYQLKGCLPSILVDLDCHSSVLDFKDRDILSFVISKNKAVHPLSFHLGAQTLKQGNATFRLPKRTTHNRNRLPDTLDHIVFLYALLDKFSRLMTSISMDSLELHSNLQKSDKILIPVFWLYNMSLTVQRDINIVFNQISDKINWLSQPDQSDQGFNVPDIDDDMDSEAVSYSPKVKPKSISNQHSPLLQKIVQNSPLTINFQNVGNLAGQLSELSLSSKNQTSTRDVTVQRISSEISISSNPSLHQTNYISGDSCLISPSQSVMSFNESVTNSLIDSNVEEFEMLPEITSDYFSSDFGDLVRGSDVHELGIDASKIIQEDLFELNWNPAEVHESSSTDGVFFFSVDDVIDPLENLSNLKFMVRLAGFSTQLDANSIEMRISVTLGEIDFPDLSSKNTDSNDYIVSNLSSRILMYSTSQNFSTESHNLVFPFRFYLLMGGGLVCGQSPSEASNFRDGWAELDMPIKLLIPSLPMQFYTMAQSRIACAGGFQNIILSVCPSNLADGVLREMPKLSNQLPPMNFQSINLLFNESLQIIFDSNSEDNALPLLIKKIHLLSGTNVNLSREGQFTLNYIEKLNYKINEVEENRAKLEKNSLLAENNALKEKLDSLISQMTLLSAELSTTKCALGESKRQHNETLSKLLQTRTQLSLNGDDLRTHRETNLMTHVLGSNSNSINAPLPINGPFYQSPTNSFSYPNRSRTFSRTFDPSQLRQYDRIRQNSSVPPVDMFSNQTLINCSKRTAPCRDLLANVTLQKHYTAAILPRSQLNMSSQMDSHAHKRSSFSVISMPSGKSQHRT